MKLSIDIESPNAFCDLIEGLTVAFLKEIKREAEQNLENCWHEDDKKYTKKRIKAVNLLLDYYGEPSDE